MYEILADVGSQMNDDAKCGHLLGYWDQPELMKPEAQAFTRMKDKGPIKDFQWTLDTMDSIVVEQEETRNREERTSKMPGTTDTLPNERT